jgi:GNAT superfamily N-acetyltransferase
MRMELRIATNETIDDLLAAAAQLFFGGSEAEARANLDPFDPSETSFILAYVEGEPVGTVTIRLQPHCPPFREAAIPFIQNIEIRHDLRGKRYGSRVMEAVERLIGERSSKAGICVGLFDAYGAAQHLYGRRRYIPDGRGACHRFTPLRHGETIKLAHDHLIWLVKDLSET